MKVKVCTIVRDSTLRNQLRQLLEAVDAVESVFTFTERADCLQSVKGGARFDLFFLEYSIAKTDVSDFITLVKNHPINRRATFISIVPLQRQNAQSLADHLLLGFHNILCEPYSVSSLESIISLSHEGNLNQTGKRMNLAAQLLVASAMGGFDEENQAPGTSLVTNVRDSCKKFCQETGVTMSGYFKQLGTKLKQSTPRERIGYTGVSERVRKNILDRLRGAGDN